jgi:DNA-binding response OmpR family regulator
MTSTCSCGKIPPTRAKILSRVLIIDDEPLVRWSLVAGLRHAGFDAIAAGTPDEARAHAQQAPAPDVVLFDLDLWGADPRALLEEIRSASPHARILILAVEGRDVALPPWNQVEIIRKPFDLHAVVGRVEAAATCPAHGQKVAV